MANSPVIKYPSLKDAADAASGVAQRSFLRLNIALLAILALVSFISGWTPSCIELQRGIGITVAGLMFITLAVTTILRIAKFDDRWFRCRALAENVKSAAWHFVMSPVNSIANSEKVYLARVIEFQKRLEQIAKDVAAHDIAGDLITPWMKATQQLPLAEKLQLYREKRLEDQRRWYLRKAQINARYEKHWFVAVLFLEFIAVAYAAVQAWQLWEVNLVGGMAAMSAGFFAWMQTKRFSDLAVSYSIAEGDLRSIAAIRSNVTTEEDAEVLVKEVETAVSREHSIWFSRRSG